MSKRHLVSNDEKDLSNTVGAVIISYGADIPNNRIYLHKSFIKAHVEPFSRGAEGLACFIAYWQSASLSLYRMNLNKPA
jgi:hypothetical protein